MVLSSFSFIIIVVFIIVVNIITNVVVVIGSDGEDVNSTSPMESYSVPPASSHHQILPTLGLELAQACGVKSARNLVHNIGRSTRTSREYATACSSSPQLAQLLTTPSQSNSANAADASSRNLSRDISRRRSVTRQKSPLATSVSKAFPQDACGNDSAAHSKLLTVIDPSPTDQPREITALGKREASSEVPADCDKPPINKKSKAAVPSPINVGIVKVIPPSGEFRPVAVSTTPRRGQMLAQAESDIGKLLSEKRRSSL